jgi:hypothetical protein
MNAFAASAVWLLAASDARRAQRARRGNGAAVRCAIDVPCAGRDRGSTETRGAYRNQKICSACFRD